MSTQLPRDQIPHFLQAIQHNRRTVLEQIQSGRFCDADYYFVLCRDGRYELLPPGRRDAELARSFNDYFAGSLVGALPFAAKHGPDGIKVSWTGLVTEVELKLCMKSEDRYVINPNGYLTIRDGKTVVNFRNDCKACYEIGNNLESKNVDTYLVLYDCRAHQLISIWMISGQLIVDRLRPNIPKDSEKAKKMSISLTWFMKNGQEVFLDFMSSVGVESWEDRIYSRDNKARPQPIPARPRSKNPRKSIWTTKNVEYLQNSWPMNIDVHAIASHVGCGSIKAVQSKAKRLGLRRP